MTHHHPHPRGRRRARLAAAPLGVLAAAVLLAGCGEDAPAASSTVAATPSETAAAPSTSTPAPALTPRASSGRQRLPGAADADAPVGITIPAIGIDSEIVPVGTDDGVLQVPPQPWVVGWWSDGVGPGTGGGTVVLDAHLDSREYGEGPFTRAKDLEVGAAATIRDSAGATHDYAVTDVVTYEKVELPYEELFAQDGPERVVLVTCGGTYQPGSGWDSNVVVILEPA